MVADKKLSIILNKLKNGVVVNGLALAQNLEEKIVSPIKSLNQILNYVNVAVGILLSRVRDLYIGIIQEERKDLTWLAKKDQIILSK